MSDLRLLDVSLTKHGAHKVAALLTKYDKDEVLGKLSGSEPGINIERAQAKKTLAANRKGVVPDFWNVARIRGSETINALVLLAVIFSHHSLISVMKQSAHKRRYLGRIERGKGIDGKAYTNFAHIIEELGFSTDHSADHIDYDLHRIFQIPGLNTLAQELLTAKLLAAKWDGKNSLVDESIGLGFHDVLSVAESQFRAWLTAGTMIEVGIDEDPEESDFFFNADDTPSSGNFIFRPGHNAKKTGTVVVTPPTKPTTATLLHNAIQNSLYEELAVKHGKKCVGTEVDTGQGTSIDVVVKTGEFCWFYEIKTARSVKACVRQAIPQLLEYAYWQGDKDLADRLIIVSDKRVTKEAEAYLQFLRHEFGLEIFYEQHKPAPLAT